MESSSRPARCDGAGYAPIGTLSCPSTLDCRSGLDTDSVVETELLLPALVPNPLDVVGGELSPTKGGGDSAPAPYP
jgi:hypothetical protein